MKYVGISEENIVVTDVLNLDPTRVENNYALEFVSVEGMSTYPSRGDTYDSASSSWTAGTPPTLDAIEARQVRDRALASSDWIMQSNTEGHFDGDANFVLSEWTAYRAALRELAMPTVDGSITHTSSTFPIRPLYPYIKGL